MWGGSLLWVMYTKKFERRNVNRETQFWVEDWHVLWIYICRRTVVVFGFLTMNCYFFFILSSLFMCLLHKQDQWFCWMLWCNVPVLMRWMVLHEVWKKQNKILLIVLFSILLMKISFYELFLDSEVEMKQRCKKNDKMLFRVCFLTCCIYWSTQTEMAHV